MNGNSLLLRNSQLLATLYLGVATGLIRGIGSLGVQISSLAHLTSCDPGYISVWLEAAKSQGIISVEGDGTVKLAATYCDFVHPDSSWRVSRTLQGVFSVLMADAMIDHFKDGVRPGFAIIERFPHLAPFYPSITENIYGSVFEVEVWPEISQRLPTIDDQFSVLDFACGDGWLLRHLATHLPEANLVGIGEPIADVPEYTGIVRVPPSEIGLIKQQFNLILLVKVAHHLGAMLPSRLAELRNMLKPNGLLCIWEFAWPVGAEVSDDDDRCFLNLLEYAQNAGYIESAALLSLLNKSGLRSSEVRICEGKEALFFAIRDSDG